MNQLRARWRLWRKRGTWDDEARVLRLRVRVGRLLDEPQDITHTVYVTSAAQAEQVRATVTTAGFSVKTQRVGPPEDPEWELSATRRALVTLDEIRTQRALLEGLVDDYDGWLATSLYEDDEGRRIAKPMSVAEAASSPVMVKARPLKRPPRWWRRGR